MWKAAFVVLAALVAVGLGSLVGAPQRIDVNDERAQHALRFAVAEHNKGTNDIYIREVEEVQQVYRQLVAGLKYIITVTMGRTSCRKDRAKEVCAIYADPEQAQRSVCTFTVVEQAWLNVTKLLNQKCVSQ